MQRIPWRFLRLLSIGLCGVLPAGLWAVSPTALEYQPPPPEPPAIHRGLMPPPENVLTQDIGGTLFASGDIYVLCHADTTELKAYGFREFDFLGRSVGTIRYHAVWPLEIDASALPMGLSGLNYAADPPRNDAFRQYAYSGGGGNGYYDAGRGRRGSASGGYTFSLGGT